MRAPSVRMDMMDIRCSPKCRASPVSPLTFTCSNRNSDVCRPITPSTKRATASRPSTALSAARALPPPSDIHDASVASTSMSAALSCEWMACTKRSSKVVRAASLTCILGRSSWTRLIDASSLSASAGGAWLFTRGSGSQGPRYDSRSAFAWTRSSTGCTFVESVLVRRTKGTVCDSNSVEDTHVNAASQRRALRGV
jgi:hypothetical protein